MAFQAITAAMGIVNIKSIDKFVLVMLASYADQQFTCFPSQNTLAADCSCSKRTIVESLKRLEKSGLISYQRRQRGNGSLTSNLYHLNLGGQPEHLGLDVVDQSANSALNTNDQSANSALGKVQNLHPRNLSTLTSKNNKKEKDKKEKIKYSQEFIEFWAVYNIGGKYPASVSFEKALKFTDPETLIMKAREYQKSQNKKFLQHASTWLNQKRWEDTFVNHKTVTNLEQYRRN